MIKQMNESEQRPSGRGRGNRWAVIKCTRLLGAQPLHKYGLAVWARGHLSVAGDGLTDAPEVS